MSYKVTEEGNVATIAAAAPSEIAPGANPATFTKACLDKLSL